MVVEDLTDEDGWIRVQARTPVVAVSCPDCGAASTRVHAYHHRHVRDVAMGARQVLLVVRVRRLVCPTDGCRRTFREQIPDVLQRYQRRTRAAGQSNSGGSQRACRSGKLRVLAAMAMPMSLHTAIRTLRRLQVPTTEAPRVSELTTCATQTVSVRHRTHRRADPPPRRCPSDRTADTLEKWLRSHPGVGTGALPFRPIPQCNSTRPAPFRSLRLRIRYHPPPDGPAAGRRCGDPIAAPRTCRRPRPRAEPRS